MRRLARAIALCSFPAAHVLAQSQVQHVPTTGPDTATANAPLPDPSDPTHPPTPNPAGPLKIAPPDKEPALPIRPAAPDLDQLSGHFHLGATASYGTFSGNFSEKTPIGSRLGGSPLVGIDLGIGLSRQLELVLTGDYSTALSGAGCADCKASSWSIGPMLRCHLVEGTRFSPWLAIGAAYRRNKLEGFSSPAIKSVEFLRLQLGGDWFATSNVALGPVLGLGIATTVAPPAHDDHAIFAVFYGGLRVVLDLPGR